MSRPVQITRSVQIDATSRLAADGVEHRPFPGRPDFAMFTRRDVVVIRELGGWRARYRFAVQRGWLVLAEFCVFPAEGTRDGWAGDTLGCFAPVPAGGLPATVARQAATLSSVLTDLQRTVAWARPEMKKARAAGLSRSDPFDAGGLWGQLGVTEPDRLEPAPTRRVAVLKRYARAAELYVSALASERRRHKPLEHVAGTMKVSYQQARDYIYRARQAGLLLPKQPTRGKTGGTLTPAARDLLSKGARHGRTTRKG